MGNVRGGESDPLLRSSVVRGAEALPLRGILERQRGRVFEACALGAQQLGGTDCGGTGWGETAFRLGAVGRPRVRRHGARAGQCGGVCGGSREALYHRRHCLQYRSPSWPARAWSASCAASSKGVVGCTARWTSRTWRRTALSACCREFRYFVKRSSVCCGGT